MLPPRARNEARGGRAPPAPGAGRPTEVRAREGEVSDQSAGPRCVALVGPYLSGKTTLLESLLFVAGAIHRRGTVKDGSAVGDSAPEARSREMSTELTVASYEYLGDPWTLIDCPAAGPSSSGSGSNASAVAGQVLPTKSNPPTTLAVGNVPGSMIAGSFAA